MTLEESKEVIPMMEAMITQIEEQQNICLLYTSHKEQLFCSHLRYDHDHKYLEDL